MDMVALNEGKPSLLDWMLRVTSGANNMFIKLYTNDVTPDDTFVYADFTGATFTGSDQITLTRSNWEPAFVAPDTGYIEYDPYPSWTNTGGGTETCYGWFCWIDGTSIAVFAQRFDTPRVMALGATENLYPFRIALETLVP